MTFAATTAEKISGPVAVVASPAWGRFPIATPAVCPAFSDAAGNTATASFAVTVPDTASPGIASVTPSAATLWPPNHQMVAISIAAGAADTVGVFALKIVGVTSNEPDNGLGEGDTAGDVRITGNQTLNLRAEHSGKGYGRIYTITVEARDAAGNTTTRTGTVSVPKSQGEK